MNAITLNTNFFIGGKATFTVDNGKGVHYTFRINKSKKCGLFFASLLTGSDNVNSYTYMGIFKPLTGEVVLTYASKFNDITIPVKVLRWAMKHVYGDKMLPEGYQIRHEGKCGCCGRALTEPTSLTIGIGPECRKRFGM